MTIRLLLPVLGTLLAWASAVESTDAVYRLRGGDRPVAHAVNGYVQTVEAADDGGLLVRVHVEPRAVGGTREIFEPDSGAVATVPEGFTLPPDLAAGLDSDLDPYARATRVLQWVDRTLVLDVSGTGFQDAASVLKRGTGRCSGLANAAVALLRTAGFDARTISGLLVTEDRTIRHRWLECRVPGAGWVPSDPTMGYWIVTSRHLAFGETVSQMPELEVLERPSARPVFPTLGGVPTRPIQGAGLVCRVISPCGGEVELVLLGRGGVRLQQTVSREGEFSGVLPGRWRLEVRRQGTLLGRRILDLREGTLGSIALVIDEERCE